MSKLYNELQKQQIVNVAANCFATELNLWSNNLAQLKEALLGLMQQITECEQCEGGSCDASTHTFYPDDYESIKTPVHTPQGHTPGTLNQVIGNMGGSSLLSDPNAGASNFLTGTTASNITPQTDTDRVRAELMDLINARMPPVNGGSATPGAVGLQGQDNTQNQHLDTTTAANGSVPQEAVGPTQRDNTRNQQPGPPATTDPVMQMILNQNQMLMGIISRGMPQPPKPAPVQPPEGRITLVSMPNLQNARAAGISLQPLMRIEGNPDTLDISKLKRKLVSGEENANDMGVLEQVYWPAHCLNRDWHQGPLPYNRNLTIAQYVSGSINKFSGELPEELTDSVTDVKLKFLGRLMLYSMQLPWSEILHISAQFYKGLERRTRTWSNWPEILAWLEIARDAAQTRVACSAAKRHKPDSPSAPSKSGQRVKTHLAGVAIEFMQSSGHCMKYQMGTCTQKGDHLSKPGSTDMLKHSCAGCAYLGKPTPGNHPSEKCPDRKKFFQSGV